MKVFVNNVDLPLGRAISRLLAHTIVGSRLSEEDQQLLQQQQQQQPEEGGEQQQTVVTKKNEPYQIVGTLSRKPTATPIAGSSANVSDPTLAEDDGFFDFDPEVKQAIQEAAASKAKPVVAANTTRILANRKGQLPLPEYYQPGTHKPEWVDTAIPYWHSMVSKMM